MQIKRTFYKAQGGLLLARVYFASITLFAVFCPDLSKTPSYNRFIYNLKCNVYQKLRVEKVKNPVLCRVQIHASILVQY